MLSFSGMWVRAHVIGVVCRLGMRGEFSVTLRIHCCLANRSHPLGCQNCRIPGLQMEIRLMKMEIEGRLVSSGFLTVLKVRGSNLGL